MFSTGFTKTAGASEVIGRVTGKGIRGAARAASATGRAIEHGATKVKKAVEHQANEFNRGFKAGRGKTESGPKDNRLIKKRHLLGLGAGYLLLRKSMTEKQPEAFQQPQVYVPQNYY